MLESLHAAELEHIVSLQRIPVPAVVMKALSNLGPSAYLVCLLGLIYVCFDSRLGARLLLVYFGSEVVSHFTKLAFHSPRPFWMDERVQAFEPTATSFGLPSGHSLVATCIWLLLAVEARRAWFWVASINVILLVSLSRVWLGAHFISDVVAGWLFGGLVLLMFFWGERRFGGLCTRLNLKQQVLLTGLVTITIVVLGFAIRATMAANVDPTQWPKYPGTARSFRSLGAYSGTVLGLGIGLAMAARWARFHAGGPIKQRVLRVLLIAAPAALYGLRPRGLLKELPDLLGFTLLFVATALAAWGFTFALPWLLIRIGLAGPSPAVETLSPSTESQHEPKLP